MQAIMREQASKSRHDDGSIKGEPSAEAQGWRRKLAIIYHAADIVC